jgi:hypothetical protein
MDLLLGNNFFLFNFEKEQVNEKVERPDFQAYYQ